jgi:hypothetical protein
MSSFHTRQSGKRRGYQNKANKYRMKDFKSENPSAPTFQEGLLKNSPKHVLSTFSKNKGSNEDKTIPNNKPQQRTEYS